MHQPSLPFKVVNSIYNVSYSTYKPIIDRLNALYNKLPTPTLTSMNKMNELSQTFIISLKGSGNVLIQNEFLCSQVE